MILIVILCLLPPLQVQLHSTLREYDLFFTLIIALYLSLNLRPTLHIFYVLTFHHLFSYTFHLMLSVYTSSHQRSFVNHEI